MSTDVDLRHDCLVDSINHCEVQFRTLADLDRPADRQALLDKLTSSVSLVSRELKILDSECRLLSPDECHRWRFVLRAHRDKVKEFQRDLEWARSEFEQANANVVIESSDFVSERIDEVERERRLLAYGQSLMAQTTDSGNNALRIIEETKAVGTETAAKLKQQGEQLTRIHDQAFEIEDTLDRAIFIGKRLGRRLATDKFIWVMIMLIVLAAIFIVVWKLAH
ncbi:t-SNARE coiled-coil homology domain-containing protein [Plasmodiophora brassicae]|uniref:t-SNARE coiled-coil homology domain-containing protein n=1 Tax=Plasmodiophora brassicae TaxID=37360 RepID=A0A0G4IJI0_PLABS|nr:hypothetical protein PBRA_004129 [Plasmodiophora brassicae]SPQ96185.1 unnamed protein product [Plasmodiophora brassicae]